ncbi:hypothetical protein ABK040_012137 [Willaertia magna]
MRPFPFVTNFNSQSQPTNNQSQQDSNFPINNIPNPFSIPTNVPFYPTSPFSVNSFTSLTPTLAPIIPSSNTEDNSMNDEISTQTNTTQNTSTPRKRNTNNEQNKEKKIIKLLNIYKENHNHLGASEYLKKFGFNRTDEQCNNKIKNLKQTLNEEKKEFEKEFEKLDKVNLFISDKSNVIAEEIIINLDLKVIHRVDVSKLKIFHIQITKIIEDVEVFPLYRSNNEKNLSYYSFIGWPKLLLKKTSIFKSKISYLATLNDILLDMKRLNLSSNDIQKMDKHDITINNTKDKNERQTKILKNMKTQKEHTNNFKSYENLLETYLNILQIVKIDFEK